MRHGKTRRIAGFVPWELLLPLLLALVMVAFSGPNQFPGITPACGSVGNSIAFCFPNR